MSDDDALSGSFWLMIAMQTIGSTDMPGGGDRKMPAPRAYLATVLIWSVLQVIADVGYAKAARTTAWLVVLTGMVFGPFGTKVANLFVRVAGMASGQDQSGPPAPTQAPTRTRTGSPTRPRVPGAEIGIAAGLGG